LIDLQAKGLIIKGIAGFYYVKTAETTYQCKARGIFKKDGVKLMVGDIASIEVLQDGSAIINSIDERKNEFIRPFISNVDCFVVVIAATKPEPNFKIVDRFLAVAEKNKADAIVCVNKIDLADDLKINGIRQIYEDIYPVAFVSAWTGDGIDELKSLMKVEKYALAGPSGTGKSTLLNILQPLANADTGEISTKTSRGKHTTRHAEIFETEFGAMLYDTPGFTSFDVITDDETELQHLFPEIEKLYGQCKYRDCSHIKEIGCAVREAVSDGKIHESRYSSYIEMYDEIINNKRR
jgi:ribosome biogenesis GTPase